MSPLLLILCYAITASLAIFLSDRARKEVQMLSRPMFDPLQEDDHGDFDLRELVSLAKTKVYHSIDDYDDEDRKMYAEHHNIYKSNFTGSIPSSSDNYFMEYNRTLEWSAREYISACVMAHGWAPNDNMTNQQGQNLYKGPSRLVSRPIYAFYMEHRWYYYKNESCREPYPPYICYHFSLMCWFNVTRMGGARRSYCFPRQFIMLIAIHFLPSGNHEGTGWTMYHMGWPCTRCPNGYLCHMGLCITEQRCRELNLDCACKRECVNCGRPDWKRCRCDCRAGWGLEDCSYRCRNRADEKYKRRVCYRRPRSMCYEKFEFRYPCREYCNDCVPKNKVKEAGVCCEGKLCEDGYILDTKTCECKPQCPSKLCMFPSSTTSTTTLPPTATKVNAFMITVPPTTSATLTTTTPPPATDTEEDRKSRKLKKDASSDGSDLVFLYSSSSLLYLVVVSFPFVRLFVMNIYYDL